MTFQKGTQIAYIPMHAEGNLKHPDVELGFVTSVNNEVAFRRYWSKFSSNELRTKANSEATPIDMLVEHQSVPQIMIAQALKAIDDWNQHQHT